MQACGSLLHTQICQSNMDTPPTRYRIADTGTEKIYINADDKIYAYYTGPADNDLQRLVHRSKEGGQEANCSPSINYYWELVVTNEEFIHTTLSVSQYVGPPNKGHFGGSHVVLCREVVLFLRSKMYWSYGNRVSFMSGCPFLGGSFIGGSIVIKFPLYNCYRLIQRQDKPIGM